MQISGVDKNSTADISGLRNGDCVLEVRIFKLICFCLYLYINTSQNNVLTIISR